MKICFRLIFPSFHLILLSAIAALGAGPASQPITDDAVLQQLDHMINWYRQVNTLDQAGVDPQEFVFRETARHDAAQTLRLAFDSARAQALSLAPPAKPTSASSSPNKVTSQTLTHAAADADARLATLQSQLDELNRELKSSAATSRPTLEARRDKLSAAINLVNAQRDVLKDYAGFVTTTESGGETDLLEKIDNLERSVPELGASADKPSDQQDAKLATQAANTQPSFHPESSGVLGLITQMFSLTSRMSELHSAADEAATLRTRVDRLHAPIRAAIGDALRRGTALSAPTTQVSDDPTALDRDRAEINSLASQFRTLSAAGVPLGEQSALLVHVQQDLDQWRSALERQYMHILRSLLIRLGAMAVTILVLVIASEMWRRATYRYVQDARRRRQLMLVRRIVIAAIVVLIVIGGVVTEFGSLATFAGLITAGIAVALQTVILSGVAYFFFIGRFGVRVGDRVTIAGISGDVIEIGLFRLYLTELAGKAPDLQPTGRIVVFSNAVLFQPTAFYKQIPNADYVWHEVTMTLAPDSDYMLAERRLMSAVESVFETYRDSIDQQFAAATSALHVILQEPRPHGHLRFVDAGIELVIRYPVEFRKAAETDDRITRKLLETIQQEPKLKLVPSKMPTIQSAA